MAWIGAAVGVVGTVLSYAGQRQQAKAAIAQGEHEQRLAEYQAGQTLAAGQRSAQEQERQARILKSRALALAAASGAGASDQGAIKLLSGIEAEGAYRAASAIYEAEDQARFLRAGGRASEYAGRARGAGYNQMAVAGLVSDASSLYNRYGRGGPDSVSVDSGYEETATSGGSGLAEY